MAAPSDRYNGLPAYDNIELAGCGGSDDDAVEGAHLLPRDDLDVEEPSIIRGDLLKRSPIKRSWLAGPQPLRKQEIRPFLPDLQSSPSRLLNHICPTTRSRKRLYFAFITSWLILFTIPLIWSSLPTTDDTGQDVVNLDCIDTLFKWKNECGLNGIDCGPFSNKTLAFRCPAGYKAVKVLNPRLIGASEVIYRPLVVGGPEYRGDSFICASAIHAGIISDSGGGCGRLDRIGKREYFPSSWSQGIESIAFDSYFPVAFTVSKDPGVRCGPGELRGVLLFISILFTSLLCIFTISERHFFTTFVAIFVHVGMVSDPPGASPYNTSTFPDHLSKLTGGLLPAIFCAIVIYKTIVARTLAKIQAPFEKTILWLGGFWFGALSNTTFEWIPITRLTAHDLKQQTGAKLALAFIIIAIFCIFVQQAYSLWLEGRLMRYLGIYAVFLSGIVFCIMIPGVEFRLHHYVLALLLLPGTSIETRPSLLYQGILLGLFVNGIARWGFASILETPAALRSDGGFDSLIPPFTASVVEMGHITFTWSQPPAGSAFDGISILVNDVERHRSLFGDQQSSENNFTWLRATDTPLPEYFRFGYMKKGLALDYSPAGIWHSNGTWDAGPARL
ncbi:hypothetical protein J7T55_015232 [Diaporthe amygdali]|uniref:uncharacterized protein n=1 Tax=Phomopsis amygdali TaxID=1214568 RepID=UPI0022FEA522|nr:uncharacterized protein J7T55_015232 [Diaporthe amygdali]KAJ0120503.1 hypothetical protein J7T55_015232 [Diaporthe amygdali]